jgi:hypothetical protein
MRALLFALLVALPGVATMQAAQADAGIAGTWTWTYPSVALPPDAVPSSGRGVERQESGTLALGPGSGQWVVELPSALVGCDAGRPIYTPKAGQTAVVQTFPDGTCRLYVISNGHYFPIWNSGRAVQGAQVGAFRGEGDFH